MLAALVWGASVCISFAILFKRIILAHLLFLFFLPNVNMSVSVSVRAGIGMPNEGPGKCT